MKTRAPNPLLIVVSAPSGTGKTTLCRMLLKEFTDMTSSISCTTRLARGNETNGREYFFLSRREFEEKKRRGDFLETAFVHGHWYGTPRAPAIAAIRNGHDILMVIDVQGAKNIRAGIKKGKDKALQAAFVDIFILPPDLSEMKRRILKRGDVSIDEMALRMNNAAGEMRCARDFRYLIVNDTLKRAYDKLRSIVIAEHCRNG